MSPLLRQCQTPDALHAWVRLFCGLNVPRGAVCEGHDAPFDYLCRAYFEPASDLVVWAPRGGGKTRLAAVATLLDLLHKPGTSIRVLGGSLEQSMKLWDYLLPDLLRLAGPMLPKGFRESARRVTLTNGSSAAVLTQSERAVRGLRVQKLRCDEAEQFDPKVWEAAQLVTRSANGVSGAIEAASTFHAPGGLMGKAIDSANARGVPVLRWCLLDVLGRCEPERLCDGCPLWDECGGRARTDCDGFLPVSDAVAMKGRVSDETWQSEMLCRRPTNRGRVFPSFDPAIHVRPFEGKADEVVMGVDFGFVAPFVCLWIAVTGQGQGRRLHVIDEYVQPGRTLPEHAAELAARRHGAVRIFCDPAGAAVNGHTASSDAAVLRRQGFRVLYRSSRIVAGVELIRRALRPAAGEPTLFVAPVCNRLITSLQGYRYPQGGGPGELPLKDGVHDHAVDALRYALVHLATDAAVRVTRY